MPRLGSLLGDSEKPPFDPLWYGNVHRPGLLVLRCFHKCNIFLASYLPVGRLDGAAVPTFRQGHERDRGARQGEAARWSPCPQHQSPVLNSALFHGTGRHLAGFG